jgi:hypothetical protein
MTASIAAKLALALVLAAFATLAFAAKPASSWGVPSPDPGGVVCPLFDDADGDGLTLALELSLGTDPNNADSDHDGIEDGNDDCNHNGTADEDEDDQPGCNEHEDDDDGGVFIPPPL